MQKIFSACRSAAFSASRTASAASFCPCREVWTRWNLDGWWWAHRWSPWVTSGTIRMDSWKIRYWLLSLLEWWKKILGLITWSWVTCVCCSWSQPWAFRSWAPLSQEPRRFCGRKPVSPSRPGPPRWEASSTASPSLAWCWMSKVPPQVTGHGSPHNTVLLDHFFFALQVGRPMTRTMWWSCQRARRGRANSGR